MTMKDVTFEHQGRTFRAYQVLNEASTEIYVRLRLIKGPWLHHSQWNEVNQIAKRMINDDAPQL